MAETTQYAALMLDANGNVDRVRTTDGKIYYIASTIAMDSAEAAQEAAANCKTAMENATPPRKSGFRPRKQGLRTRPRASTQR